MNNEYKFFYNFYNALIQKNNNVENLYNILQNTENISSFEMQLIDSLMWKNRYSNKLKLDKFLIHIDILENMTYYEDVAELIEEIKKKTDDPAQINTLMRILKQKPHNDVQVKNNDNSYIKIIKACPHCDKKYVGGVNSEYVVCGYSDTYLNKGYDWLGCGRDWCFKCEKKLCKSWNSDELYNRQNQYHNKKCCKHYAREIGDRYPDDYCQCNNNRHVRRS